MRIERDQLNTIVFCARQDSFVWLMNKLKIGRVEYFQDCYDPLIPSKFLCKYVEISIPKFLVELYSEIHERINDREGIELRDRLIRRGLIEAVEE